VDGLWLRRTVWGILSAVFIFKPTHFRLDSGDFGGVGRVFGPLADSGDFGGVGRVFGPLADSGEPVSLGSARSFISSISRSTSAATRAIVSGSKFRYGMGGVGVIRGVVLRSAVGRSGTRCYW
jgi:hypothetical protein